MKTKKITLKMLLMTISAIFLTSCGLLTDPVSDEKEKELIEISLSSMTFNAMTKEEGKAKISSFTIPANLEDKDIEGTVEFHASDSSVLNKITAVQKSLYEELNKHLPNTIDKTTLNNFNVQIGYDTLVVTITLKPKDGYKFPESVNPNNDGSAEISVLLKATNPNHFGFTINSYTMGLEGIVFNDDLLVGNSFTGMLETPQTEKIPLTNRGGTFQAAKNGYNVTLYKGDKTATTPRKTDFAQVLQKRLQNNANLNGYDITSATVRADSDKTSTVANNDKFTIRGIYTKDRLAPAPDISVTLIVTSEENSVIQQKFKTQWMENTKNINVDNRYFGEADIWGGGALDLYFWFVDGNLWDAWTDVPSGYVLHKLLTDSGNSTGNKATFIDGNTALMFMPSSASSTIASYGVFYIVRVKDNKIYRTRSAWGWGGDNRGDALRLGDWDGKTIPKGALEVGDNYYNLVVIGEPK